MIELMRAQIADYPRVHRARVNLAIHVLAVPAFWAGLGILAAAALHASVRELALAATLLGVSIGLQAWGHARETERARPFTGPLNFALRLTTESLVVFPRYVATGGWRKAWAAAERRR